jgi:pilus assembly protein CpaF
VTGNILPAGEDLRSLIRTAWNRRRLPPLPAGQAHDSPAEPGLRQRLFQRILKSLETPSTGVSVRARVRRIIEESPDLEGIDEEWLARIESDLIDEVDGLGPVASLLRDPTVSDILINGPSDVWVDRFGKLERSSVRFEDETHLRRILRRMVGTQGRRLDEAVPYVDLRLPDGSRLNAVLSPVSLRGTVVSIRRAREASFRMEDLVAFGSLTAEIAELLSEAVRLRRNVLVSGGSGAGKTTLLNVLSRAIPPDERIVTIEETAELRLEHPHVIALEGRQANVEGSGGIDLRVLVRNALRMRADRIIVGEVRGAEAFEMLQAMHVGHDGSLTTIHANSVHDALRRLESLVLMGGVELGAATVSEIIASSIHLIVQLSRFPDGSRRITSVAEVVRAGGTTTARELFVYRLAARRFERSPAAGEFLLRLAAGQERSR